jgi:hypothetical protein
MTSTTKNLDYLVYLWSGQVAAQANGVNKSLQVSLNSSVTGGNAANTAHVTVYYLVHTMGA